MKTIAVILILACLGLCLAKSFTMSEDSKPTNEWGDTSEEDIDFIITRHVFAEGEPNTAQVRDLIYPRITIWKKEIVGIKHFDHADRPVNVTFIQENLPQSKVYFLIQSQLGYGINSTFQIYGRYLDN